MSDVERLGWDDFTARLDWRQGEHVSLIGPTGGGKTTLGLALLNRRAFVVAFGTKPADDTLDRLVRRPGWRLIREWRQRPPLLDSNGDGRPDPQRLVLWPKFERMADVPRHRAIFRDALHAMFTERSWCVFADEAFYLSKTMGLDAELRQYWTQGRSIRLSLVAATQRPAWVPLELYSQATHLFLWRSTDRRDLDRLRDISGPVDPKTLMGTVATLDWWAHEVLYVNTRTGEMIVTVPPKA